MITQADILRHHALWQRSWTGPTIKSLTLQDRYSFSPASSYSSDKYERNLIDTPKSVTSGNMTSPLASPNVDNSPQSRRLLSRRWKSMPPEYEKFASETEEDNTLCMHKILDNRRQKRIDRRRPWTEKALFSSSNRDKKIEFFYESSLPSDIDTNVLKRRTRQYVANVKYGNIYELRHKDTPRKEKEKKQNAWLWERDFLIWLNEKESGVKTSLSNRSNGGDWAWDLARTAPTQKKTQWTYSRNTRTSAGKTDTPISSIYPTSSRTTPRRSTTPKLRASRLRSLEEDKPHADLFAHYHSYRLEKQVKKDSAVKIQKLFRGYLLRKHMDKLKRKARLEHSSTWQKFIQEYRYLVKRIQERYGVKKPECGIELKEVEAFMENKKKYDEAFQHLAYGDKMLKEDLPDFFNYCGLFPTEGEITKAFDAVFKGNGNTAEIIFLLDCSTSVGPLSFYHLTNFVKDVVASFDIGPNRVRVGVVPYSDDVFQSFGITDHNIKSEVQRAIDEIKHKEGLTRTDLAIRKMKSYFMASRPGVQRTGIVITDGRSSEPQKTACAAKEIHHDNINMISIGIGRKVDMDELKTIASSERNVLTACDYNSLHSLKETLARKTCLEIKSKSTNLKQKCRPLQKAEAMEILWTVYPPPACKLSEYRSSRWIRPIINGTEAWSLLDQNMIMSTDIRTCLQLVIQSKIERQGHVVIPSDCQQGVGEVTNPDEAIRVLEKYLKYKQEHSE